MRRKGKIVQTCCGGIPVRNGRCSVCGDIFPDEEDSEILRFSRKKKKSKSFNELFTSVRV